MLTKENRRLGALRAHVTRTKRLLEKAADKRQRDRLRIRLRAQQDRVVQAEAGIAAHAKPQPVAEPFASRDAALTQRESDVLNAMRDIELHQEHLNAARARMQALLEKGWQS
jgi:hypothetical protein